MTVIKTDNWVSGFVVDIIDDDPHNYISATIKVDGNTVGTYKVNHYIDIIDQLGRSVSVFKTAFKSFKITEQIEIVINTKLRNNQIEIKLF